MPIIQDLNVDQLKVPLGFIKVPQLLLAVIAFTARSGWEFSASFSCGNGKKVSIVVPSFMIDEDSYGDFKPCDGRSAPLVLFDHSLSAQFFGFVAMVSIVFVCLMLFLYVCRWGYYAGDERLPKLDCIITMVLAVAWFLAAWTWWSATSSLKDETSNANLNKGFESHKFCDTQSCNFRSYAITSPLTVSVLAGFSCLLLFASNIWFVYKETAWFRDRNTPQISQPIA